MLCKKACPSTNMGRGKALKYKLLSESDRHLFGQITVPRNGLAPYVGFIKLDEKRCGKVTGRINLSLTDTGPEKKFATGLYVPSRTFRSAPLSTQLLVFRNKFERENLHGP